MKRQKRPTAAELRQTLGAFIFTADDLLTPDAELVRRGGAEVQQLGMKRLSAAARIRSLTMSDDRDVERVKEADERKAAAAPKPGPEWIETKETK